MAVVVVIVVSVGSDGSIYVSGSSCWVSGSRVLAVIVIFRRWWWW